MKALIKQAVKKMGFDIVKLKNNNFTLGSNFMNIIRARKIGCVFDVGANTGQYGKFLRQIGYQGHILSFEPVRHVFETLQSAAEHDPKWICFQNALGDREEQKEINVYESTDFSSFLEANAYCKNTFASVEITHTEPVQVRLLQDIYSDVMKDIGDVPCMLKMDTQGYDIIVFRGSFGILDRIEAIQSEISIINIYDDMPDGLDALRMFRGHGYDVSGMFPVNRDKTLAAIEFDCLFVKRHG